MSDENVRFKFDLDAKDAVAQAKELHDKILSIGDSKNLSGLIESFTQVAGPIFAAGASLLAVKKLMDFTVEGDAVLRVQNSFKQLTEQYGLSAEELKSGLEKSTRGMVAMDDVTKAANEAITLLGKNANKLPEIMDLARMAGKRFGVDTIQAFELLNSSIASGTTRRLRQLGLTVDLNSAEEKYALSIGSTVERLSQQGKQTALLNAVLELGQEKYKSGSSGVISFSESLKILSASVKEVYDKFTVWVSKNYGEFFSDMTQGITKLVKGISGTKSAGDDIKKLEDNIDSLQIKINKMSFEKFERKDRKGIGAVWGQLVSGEGADEILDQNLEKAKKRLEHDKAALAELQEKEPKTSGSKALSGGEDNSKKLLAESQFNQQLLQLRESRSVAQNEIETNDFNYYERLLEQSELAEAKYSAKIAEISAQSGSGKKYTAQEAANMIAQIEEEKAAKIMQLDRDMEESSKKVYDNQLKAAQSVSAGFSAAAKISAADLNNQAKQGEQVFKIISKGASTFFQGIGEGSKDAGQLMKEFLLGSLAEIVQMKGEAALALGMSSLGGPSDLAAGAALITLSGVIRSMAGSGGSSSSGGGGSSGGSVGGSTGLQPSSLAKPSLDTTPQKSVTIQIQGSYFETEQSKTRLVEMIRETNDATNYMIQSIGVK